MRTSKNGYMIQNCNRRIITKTFSFWRTISNVHFTKSTRENQINRTTCTPKRSTTTTSTTNEKEGVVQGKGVSSKYDDFTQSTIHENQDVKFRILEFPASKKLTYPSSSVIVDSRTPNDDNLNEKQKHTLSNHNKNNEFIIYQSSYCSHTEKRAVDCTNKENSTVSASTSSSSSWITYDPSKLNPALKEDDKKDAFNSSSMNQKSRYNFHDWNTNIHNKLIIPFFFPTNYPQSVTAGYSHYAFYSFLASIAGSANMVLSTQTLLLAMMTTTTGAIVPDIIIESGIVNSNEECAGFSVDSESTIVLESAASAATGNEVDKSVDSTSSSSLQHDDSEPYANVVTDGNLLTPSTVTKASVMAGALHWVMKDGVGQLGGVWYASYVNQYNQLDSNPKYYRMLSSVALDVAALIEIMTPMLMIGTISMQSFWILPIACISTVLKNIAYITASASRAAIHQTLITTTPSKKIESSNRIPNEDNTSRTPDTVSSSKRDPHMQTTNLLRPGNNLADVTAKSGSQTMVGSLIGTSLGIGISSAILQGDLQYFLGAFVLLSATHQFCTYQSLKYIALRHFNYQRLMIVFDHYIEQNLQQKHNDDSKQQIVLNTTSSHDPKNVNFSMLSPEEVAKMESIISFPKSLRFLNNRYDFEHKMMNVPIVVGDKLSSVCPNGYDEFNTLRKLLEVDAACEDSQNKGHSKVEDEAYIMNVVMVRNNDDKTHIKQENHIPSNCTINLIFFEHATNYHVVKGMFHALLMQKELLRDCRDNDYHKMISKTYQMTNEYIPTLWIGLNEMGWDFNHEFSDIEPPDARRITFL